MLNFSEEQLAQIERCITEENAQYNLNKAYEELAEFQEALVKRQTKGRWNTQKPSFIDLEGEFCDIVFRGFIALAQEFKNDEQIISEKNLTGLQESVSAYIAKKLERTKNYTNS